MEKKAGKKETHDKKPEAAKKEAHKEPHEAKAAPNKAHHHATSEKKEHPGEDHSPARHKHAPKADGTKSAKSKAAKAKQETQESSPHPRPKQQCKIQGCKREYRAKGYCRAHYRKWRHGEYGRARFKTCKDYGCLAPMARNRHGFCEEHFQNYYVKGMEQSKIAVEKPAAKPETKAAEKVA